jgi:hypothetical protein
MKRWLKAQFADVEHARRAILISAAVMGTCGFCMLMAALLLAR